MCLVGVMSGSKLGLDLVLILSYNVGVVWDGCVVGEDYKLGMSMESWKGIGIRLLSLVICRLIVM